MQKEKERIQTRFKGDCDKKSMMSAVLPIQSERIQTRFKGDCDQFILSGFLQYFFERIQTRFKGDCDLKNHFALFQKSP